MLFSLGKTYQYTVNPMEDGSDERGCIAWLRRNIVDRVPTLALVILAVFILILLLSAIPLAIFITYMAPSAQNVAANPQSVARMPNDKDWPFGNSTRSGSPMRTSILKPPNITSCIEHGFSCTSNPSIIIGFNKRCDGEPDCPDESDEAECDECRTSFSCPLRTGGSYKHCLRGHALCDGYASCEDQGDEHYYCHANCDPGFYKCAYADRCIPNAYRCDGDEHCPGGDDEDQCKACTNRAIHCKITGRCVPIWMQCDGHNHCPNAIDEIGCNCTGCSSAKSAFCTRTNMCIDKSQVCDGAIDCADGEDEERCAGSCAGRPDVHHREIMCRDGRLYEARYACSGLYEQCQGLCDECSPDMAISCGNNTCLHRSRVCDGIADCADGVDERDCGACDASEKLCDGYPDCQDGHDERNCTSCKNGAYLCKADRKCVSSTQRCDGSQQCSDAQDENGCTCDECALHPFLTYFCEQGKRCFRKDEVCSPHSRCPHPSAVDKTFCATRRSRFSFF